MKGKFFDTNILIYLYEKYRYSFFDSLILASALESGCDKVYSEDMKHGQNIESLQIVNPFISLKTAE